MSGFEVRAFAFVARMVPSHTRCLSGTHHVRPTVYVFTTVAKSYFFRGTQLTRCSALFVTSLHRIDPRCPIRRCPIRRRPTGAAVEPHRFRRWHCPHFRMLLSVSSGRPSDSPSVVHAKHRYGSSLPGYGGHVRRRCSGSATPSGAGMDYRRCRPLHGVAVTRSCCVFAFYGTSMPVRTRTFSSVRSSIAECTPSLPVPESFTPP